MRDEEGRRVRVRVRARARLTLSLTLSLNELDIEHGGREGR